MGVFFPDRRTVAKEHSLIDDIEQCLVGAIMSGVVSVGVILGAGGGLVVV